MEIITQRLTFEEFSEKKAERYLLETDSSCSLSALAGWPHGENVPHIWTKVSQRVHVPLEGVIHSHTL